MSKFFVYRPIVAIVIAVLMITFGVIVLGKLPITQYPEISPPTVTLSANYPGADALTVEQSVAAPIEQQMSGIEKMSYMSSVNGSDGSMSLTVAFDLNSDIASDQIQAQMRSSQANAQLPEDVRSGGVNVQKAGGLPLIMFALTSDEDRYDAVFLANYAQININDQMIRVPGIGGANIFGPGKYAMRIWVKPDQLAKLNLTIPDITNAIRSQNRVNPAGQIGGEPAPAGQQFTYSVKVRGRLVSEEEFRNIVIRANTDGTFIRLGDVARVELGAQAYNMISRYDGKPAALVALNQAPGTNALNAAKGAQKRMEELAKNFPPGMRYEVALDTTLAVEEGINEIQETLLEALLLVIFVVYIFLQGWRATLIPVIAVPVSLLATFIVFPIIGFSVNTLSLFGLVLAIGLVVDDPIVVVESVEKNLEEGLSRVDATLKTMSEVKGPIIATSLVLLAVFLPTVFIPGISGRLYQQFAVTVCVSVCLSAFNSLTLSPALCALLLTAKREHVAGSFLGRSFSVFDKMLGVLTKKYISLCRYLIQHQKTVLVSMAFFVAVVAVIGYKLPSAFIPDEDQGFVLLGIQLPTASSLQRTDLISKKVENVIKSIDGIKGESTIVGLNLLSGVNNSYGAFFFITLNEWKQRADKVLKAEHIIMRINKELSSIPDALAFAFSPPAIPGVGASGGISMVIQDRGGHDADYLAQNVNKFISAASAKPQLAGVSTTLLPNVPQIMVDVDRDKAMKHGVDLSDIYTTLQSYMGSGFVNFFTRFGRQWMVYVEAEGEYRDDPMKLDQFYVKNKEGKMVPLDTLTTVTRSEGPEFTTRHNLFRAATINAMAAPGYSTGQAMEALEDVFNDTLPVDMGYEYSGMSFQENQAKSTAGISTVFVFALFCVYLILAAQYESWMLPLSVLAGTPIAVFGAFIALELGSFSLNIYAQIGLIMLVGLAAKNAILIVEYSNQLVRAGSNYSDAALKAAELRFRPILMTAFAFIFGVLPLVFANGAGAVSRQVMGFTILGGMLASTVIAILIIPVAFVMVSMFFERMLHRKQTGHNGG